MFVLRDDRWTTRLVSSSWLKLIGKFVLRDDRWTTRIFSYSFLDSCPEISWENHPEKTTMSQTGEDHDFGTSVKGRYFPGCPSPSVHEGFNRECRSRIFRECRYWSFQIWTWKLPIRGISEFPWCCVSETSKFESRGLQTNEPSGLYVLETMRFEFRCFWGAVSRKLRHFVYWGLPSSNLGASSFRALSRTVFELTKH